MAWPSTTAPLLQDGRCLRLAHRGDARRAPENTIPALLAALTLDACDGLEFDVRVSADDEPVLLHDETLRRVQGRPDPVHELTAAELEAVGVPSLAAALDAIPHGAFLDVELKVDGGRRLVEVLAGGRGPGLHNAVVSSFEPDAIARVRALAPSWSCWLNADDASVATIDQARELGCVGIAVSWRALDERSIRRAGEAGLTVAAWTVRRRPTVERLEREGVGAICVEGAALG
jgi:glycerophosphoryl diester phosphodiesterase